MGHCDAFRPSGRARGVEQPSEIFAHTLHGLNVATFLVGREGNDLGLVAAGIIGAFEIYVMRNRPKEVVG